MLVWRDRTGRISERVGQPQEDMSSLALSPDGRRVAIKAAESGESAIWLHDLANSTRTRLTFGDGSQSDPGWSPDGGQVVYREVGDANGYKLVRSSADGTGDTFTIVESEGTVRNPDWSHDGRYLIYQEGVVGGTLDIHYVQLEGGVAVSEPIGFLKTRDFEVTPQFSPDGGLVAYVSDREVFLRTFPNGTGQRQVSAGGGLLPRWRSDGEELYYLANATLMAVSVSRTGGRVDLGQPTPLFDTPGLIGTVGAMTYDVSPDGQRFIMAAPYRSDGGEQGRSKVHVVLNWYEEFRDREH